MDPMIISDRVRRWSPEIKYLMLVTAWGLAFLPQMYEQLLLAIVTPYSIDFEIFAGASQLVWAGADPYSLEACRGCAYRYTPLFAYLFVPLAALGHTAWAALHFAAIFAFPLRIARIVPLLWPFWWDVGVGSNMIFIALFGFYAMKGRAWAIAATLAIAILIPRPLMAPLVVWLLWHHRGTRFPFAVAALGSLGFAYGTGHLARWMEILVSSGSELGVSYNVGPSAVIGLAWVPTGMALAALLTWRGQVGWASLVISPYWLPYYLTIPIADLQKSHTINGRSPRADAGEEGIDSPEDPRGTAVSAPLRTALDPSPD